MNPFYLKGFSFLAFYLLFAIAVQWALRRWIRNRELEADLPTPQLASDPYQIAYLRGGEKEAMRVATFSLIDRGLLTAEGALLQARRGDPIDFAQRPIEKAILRHYAGQGTSEGVFTDAATRAACDGYRNSLRTHRLLPDDDIYSGRIMPVLCALALLTGVAVTKIVIAFSQGRHNIGFLIILTIVFCAITITAYSKRITGRGEALLDDLKILFARLKSRAAAIGAGGQTHEAALVAAVFGLGALPALAYPYLKHLYPAQASSSSGDRDSSSSSSSSDSSSSCGSSCGGGCGGGCGG